MSNILIIGVGRIGKALGLFLEIGNKVTYWDHNPKKVTSTISLTNLAKDADYIFICVPSWSTREVIGQIATGFNNNAIVVSLAKGIEEASLKTMDQLLGQYFPKDNFALLGGGMMAEEIEMRLPTFGALATPNEETYHKIEKIFARTPLVLEHFPDIHGVALCGVLKNIYSISVGLADGLQLGLNVSSWIISQSLKEMALIVTRQDGKRETVYSIAGLGDLLATCLSPHSSNHQIGLDLARGKVAKDDWKNEGLSSFPAIIKLIKEDFVGLTILKTLFSILAKNKKPQEVYSQLLK